RGKPRSPPAPARSWRVPRRPFHFAPASQLPRRPLHAQLPAPRPARRAREGPPPRACLLLAIPVRLRLFGVRRLRDATASLRNRPIVYRRPRARLAIGPRARRAREGPPRRPRVLFDARARFAPSGVPRLRGTTARLRNRRVPCRPRRVRPRGRTRVSPTRARAPLFPRAAAR